MTNNTKDTVVAFARLPCMGLTSFAAMFGFAMDAELAYSIVSVALFAVATVWGWWKNNNVTAAASEAQDFVKIIKANTPRCDMVGDDDGEEA